MLDLPDETAEEHTVAAGPTQHPEPVQVTIVEAPGCHLCTDAHDALAQLAADGLPIQVTTLDLRDPAGASLLRHHGAGMSPLVLLDGEFFSQGRLPRRKLARLLHERPPSARATTGA